jgi:hypothetical protein
MSDIDEKDDGLDFVDIPRDEHGRFAPKTQEPAPPADQPPAPPPVAEPPPVASPAPPADQPDQPPPGRQWVDAALLDEREKRREAVQRAQELERKLQEYEAKKTAPPPIDPLTDPDGWQQQISAQREKDRQDARFEMSEMMALTSHGQEKVMAAVQWLDSELQKNPAFFHVIAKQPHPYDFVVKQHERHSRLSKIGDDDPESWAQKWAEQNGYVRVNPQPGASGASPPPNPRTPPPRSSIAGLPSAAASSQPVAQSDEDIFKEVFGR